MSDNYDEHSFLLFSYEARSPHYPSMSGLSSSLSASVDSPDSHSYSPTSVFLTGASGRGSSWGLGSETPGGLSSTLDSGSPSLSGRRSNPSFYPQSAASPSSTYLASPLGARYSPHLSYGGSSMGTYSPQMTTTPSSPGGPGASSSGLGAGSLSPHSYSATPNFGGPGSQSGASSSLSFGLSGTGFGSGSSYGAPAYTPSTLQSQSSRYMMSNQLGAMSPSSSSIDYSPTPTPR
ncbi:hypothetical protein Ciccas_012180 [Cichlidogyrus casuarinus]|uniref:Uncharacterized protein n=1 Tax=Cichlidogyrus casuarinus TaxID=1844966 RepID=A0ABD2PP49_9PLAT